MDVSARALPSAAHALRVRIDVRAHASSSIDFLAAQLLGHCSRPGEGNKSLHDDDEAAAGSLTDAAGAMGCCVLASTPKVVAAGVTLAPHATTSFVVCCDRLPTGLPPSFDGGALCCEYLLLVTLRTMAPQAQSWYAYLTGDDDGAASSSWVHGPIRRLRLPLHYEGDAASEEPGRWRRGGPGALRCELRCDEVAAGGTDATIDQPWGDATADDDDDDDDDDDTDEEDDEGDDDDEQEAMADAAATIGGKKQARVEVQLDGAPLASIELASDAFFLGGAVRGTLRLLAPASRVSIAVLCVEVVVATDGQAATGGAPKSAAADQAGSGEETIASSRLVAKAELTRGGPQQLRTATFELPLPAHLPPSSTLTAADGSVAVELRWVAQVTFERGESSVPWRVPLRVTRSGDTSRRADLEGYRARPLSLATRRLAAPGMSGASEGVELRVE